MSKFQPKIMQLNISRLRGMLRKPRTMAFLVEHFGVSRQTIGSWFKKCPEVRRTVSIPAKYWIPEN